jgi:hypothetical protein
MAMGEDYQENGAFTSCSEDEEEQPECQCCMAQVGADPPHGAAAAADHTPDGALPVGFHNLAANETGTFVVTLGDL